jgi:hypothetical protein
VSSSHSGMHSHSWEAALCTSVPDRYKNQAYRPNNSTLPASHNSHQHTHINLYLHYSCGWVCRQCIDHHRMFGSFRQYICRSLQLDGCFCSLGTSLFVRYDLGIEVIPICMCWMMGTNRISRLDSWFRRRG